MNYKEEIPTINTKELIVNLSPQRADNESFSDYKLRQRKNKNIIKAKRIQWFREFRQPEFFRYLKLQYHGYPQVPNF